MISLLLFVHVVASNGQCNFPDNQYITPDLNNLEYIGESCVWNCKERKTGRGCAETCDSHFCDIGMRLEQCKPPSQEKCVMCAQNSDEAQRGGYSFDKGSNNNLKYELLNGMGSFDNAKIYPGKTPIRNAIKTNGSTDEVVAWADILFPLTGEVTWSGIGKVDLHYEEGKGAMESDVFAVLTAPYAKLKACSIQTRDVRGGNYHYINGLVYEFYYRQRISIMGQVIRVKSELIPEGGSHAMVDDSFILPSTDQWTRSRQLFDYTDLYGDPNADPPDYSCIQIAFHMQQYNEMLIDELRVFANLFRNSQFNVIGSWDVNPPINVGDEQWDEWTHNGYVVLNGTKRIQQQVTLAQYDTLDSVVATTFSMEVRGNGILVVKYMLDQQSASGGFDGSVEHEEYLIVLSITDDSDEGTGEWQILEVPLTMHVRRPTHDVHTILISNYDPNIKNALHIDNVFLYADDRRCPVLSCNDADKRVFVNGRCELCTFEDGNVCDAGFKQAGCTMAETQMEPTCNPCPQVHDYNALTATLTLSNGEFVATAEECTYECIPGWWYSRDGVDDSGPICKQCTSISALRCHVGWYAATCMQEADATCLPCDILDQYDNSVVYTTVNYTTSAYSETAAIQCKHVCAPDQFQYGVRVNSGIPMCFPCTKSICGTTDNDFSAFRVIDGLQYTSQCTASQDSKCQRCESDDAAVLVTENGNRVDEWCQYECAAGSMPCGTCLWQPSHAENSRNATHYSTYGIGAEAVPPSGHIPLNQNLMVRFTGNSIISNAQFGSQVAIKVYVTTQNTDDPPWYLPNETGWVLRLFPVVPPAALAAMRQGQNVTVISDTPIQQFDVTIEIRDFINTNSFQSWNDATIRNGVTAFLTYELVVVNPGGAEPTASMATLGSINVSDFVVQKQNSIGGCCAERDAINPQPVDHKAISRCTACDHAMGITGTYENPLPANAHWDTPNSCGWACNKNYELLQGGDGRTCEHCEEQICTNGRYWDVCDTCLECEPAAPNANFIGPGTTRYDNTSCPVECSEAFYYNAIDKVCVPCTASNMLNCSTDPRGDFFERQCGGVNDAMCVNCRICPLGYNASTPCSGYHDSVCIACDTSKLHIPVLSGNSGVEWSLGKTSNDYCAWRCVEGSTYNPLANTCVICYENPCTIGYYRVPCTSENNFTGCARCVSPDNAIMLSSGIESQNNSCVWECPEDMDYNVTMSLCVPRPVVVTPTINIVAEIPCEHATITVLGVVSHVCGWGWVLDLTRIKQTELQLQNGMIACNELCTRCATLPDVMMYVREGSCDWVCRNPLMWDGVQCVNIVSDV